MPPVERINPPEQHQQPPEPLPRLNKPVAPKDFFAAVEKLPQSEQRLTRAQARQLLNTIGDQTYITEPFYKVIKIKTKKYKKKKYGTGRNRLSQAEKNYRQTGDTFGLTVSGPYNDGPGIVYDPVPPDPGSDEEQQSGDSEMEEEMGSAEEDFAETEDEISDSDSSDYKS